MAARRHSSKGPAGKALAPEPVHPVNCLMIESAKAVNLEAGWPLCAHMLFTLLVYHRGVTARWFDACAQGLSTDPLDMGGVGAFDLKMYKSCLKSDGEYTCNICFSQIPLLGWTHKSIPPGRGQELVVRDSASLLFLLFLPGAVKIMEQRHFRDAEGAVVCPSSWSDVLHIRAMSLTEPPTVDTEVLNGDAYSASLRLKLCRAAWQGSEP